MGLQRGFLDKGSSDAQPKAEINAGKSSAAILSAVKERKPDNAGLSTIISEKKNGDMSHTAEGKAQPRNIKMSRFKQQRLREQ